MVMCPNDEDGIMSNSEDLAPLGVQVQSDLRRFNGTHNILALLQ